MDLSRYNKKEIASIVTHSICGVQIRVVITPNGYTPRASSTYKYPSRSAQVGISMNGTAEFAFEEWDRFVAKVNTAIKEAKEN